MESPTLSRPAQGSGPADCPEAAVQEHRGYVICGHGSLTGHIICHKGVRSELLRWPAQVRHAKSLLRLPKLSRLENAFE